jgi:protein-S-isoprenylcysteine O-methyltransferase Ste14
VIPAAIIAFSESGWMERLFGDGIEDAWDYALLALALTGLALRAAVIGFAVPGTSGRATRAQSAVVLNTTGMYSLMRHPLYLGNFLTFLAFVFLFKSALFALFACAAYALYYERIMMAEEAYLEAVHGNQFRAWADRTPAFFPRVRGWQRPSRPYSWRKALGSEYHGIFLIGTVFLIVEALEGVLLDQVTFAQWVHEEPFWILFFAASAAFYGALVVISKRTRWLSVAA